MHVKNESALTPVEREALRVPFPVREAYSTREEYASARVSAGLDCRQCGTMIYLPQRKGPTLCSSCASMSDDKEWSNSRAIRCPDCRAIYNAIDYPQYVQNGVLAWQCTCGCTFDVKVEVDYTFTSEPVLSTKEQN